MALSLRLVGKRKPGWLQTALGTVGGVTRPHDPPQLQSLSPGSLPAGPGERGRGEGTRAGGGSCGGTGEVEAELCLHHSPLRHWQWEGLARPVWSQISPSRRQWFLPPPPPHPGKAVTQPPLIQSHSRSAVDRVSLGP